MKNSLYPVFLIFSLLIASPLTAGAMSEETKAFFHSLQSPILEIIDQGHPYFDESLGDYPWYARIVQQEIFKAHPTGKPFWTRSECDFKTWQDRVLRAEPNSDFESFADQTGALLQECEGDFQAGHRNIVSNTIFAMNLGLDVKNHPFAKHVVINLPSGVRLKGFLAMKADGKKRPLIIFRTGIFSNTQEFYAERFLFMMGFEQSPFNMLVIESISGSEFVKHNNSLTIGGFDEGLQNFWIAQQFQKSTEPISKYTQSVHLLGMSMGGHGTMFATLLNEYNPRAISSSLAFCPLLNVQETLDYHQSQGFSMSLMNMWASRRLSVLGEKNSQLRSSTFIQDGFDELKKNYHQSLMGPVRENTGIILPSPMEEALEDKTSPGLFWKLNQFWSYYQNVKTPVFIFATRKDPIVSWFINSGRIQDGRLDLSSSKVRLFPLDEGYHCSLSVAYDWEKMATLLQTYFLKYSPEFERENKEVRVPLPRKVIDYYGGKNEISPVIDMDFEIPKGESSVQVHLNFLKSPRPNMIDRWLAPEMEVALPLSEMEYPRRGVVEKGAEQNLLKRWAYQNIQVRIENQDLVFSWPITK